MAVDATDRWVMTTAFLQVGACYIITGTALRPARLAGRLILIAGAAAGMLVAANPQPAAGGGSVPHAIWAALGFAGLAAWPAGACQRGSPAPWACGRVLLRRRRSPAHSSRRANNAGASAVPVTGRSIALLGMHAQ